MNVTGELINTGNFRKDKIMPKPKIKISKESEEIANKLLKANADKNDLKLLGSTLSGILNKNRFNFDE